MKTQTIINCVFAVAIAYVGYFVLQSNPKARQVSFSVEKEMEKPKELTPEEEEQLLKLGIDDGTEKSTMTWIPYKDYQEQFARKSEAEQAAIKETNASRRPAKPTTAATISVLRTGKIYFNREEVEMKDVEVKVREAKAADPKTVVYLAIEDGQGVTDRAPILQDLWDRLQDEGVNIQMTGGAKAKVEAALPSPASPPKQQAAAPPANPSRQTPATQPGAMPSKPMNGEKSNLESDATSIVDVPQSKWRNGRPLASKGLNVRTQRPVFDERTTISTALANPIIEIDFDKEGVPTKNTRILQSSGSLLIDQPILDCLFRWRASGSQLTNLPEGKTLKYRIRILLNK